MSDIQNPQGQPQCQPTQPPQPPQYQQPQYQQPYGGQTGYAPRPSVNIWEGIAKWDFKVVSYIVLGVFFLSLFMRDISTYRTDRTTILLFQFFFVSSLILASFLCYSKAAPRMKEGNDVGWPLLVGGIVAVFMSFILTFIKAEDYDTIKTLTTIGNIALAVSAFSLLYAFFRVKVFQHSLPVLLLGMAFVLELMGYVIGYEESFGQLCVRFSLYAEVSSMIVLLAEVAYNRSLNRG